MGRTWRKNSEFGHKSAYKDEQRRLRKEAEKAQKATQKGGRPEQDANLWSRLKKERND